MARLRGLASVASFIIDEQGDDEKAQEGGEDELRSMQREASSSEKVKAPVEQPRLPKLCHGKMFFVKQEIKVVTWQLSFPHQPGDPRSAMRAEQPLP